jgi:hypothetical protein
VYAASRFLFWTIITVAARHDSSDFSLLQDLIPAVKALLWSTVADVPHTLPSLQAMAILCVWPFPVSSMPTDNTFLLAGILKSAATHVGLHRPENLMQYSRVRVSLSPTELTEARRAWCCIFVAIDGYALCYGIPRMPLITLIPQSYFWKWQPAILQLRPDHRASIHGIKSSQPARSFTPGSILAALL